MIYNGFIQNSSEIRGVVKNIIENINASCSISKETQYGIELVLRELLANGILYSCDKIRLMVKQSKGCIRAAIIDDGDGFDHLKYTQRDITSEEMLLSENGRGIYISSSICEKFKYNRKGNIVAIRINLV